MKKILIIEPPFYRLFKHTYSLTKYPLALGYLAETINKETNWKVQAYNTDFHPESEMPTVSHLVGKGFENYLNNLKDSTKPIWNEIKKSIQEFNPDVVGISVKSQNFAATRIIVQIVKEINKNTITIIGGPHPSMVGKEVFKCKNIDIAVRGEGEKTIVELLTAIQTNSKLDKIKGIIFKNKEEIIETPPRELIENLDSLCFPYEHAKELLKDYEKYPISAYKCIFTIRGCPFNCFFCGSRQIWGRKPRFRSPENIIQEIKGLQKKGVKRIHFDDDTFGISKDHINKLCNLLIQECPGLKWSCEIHVKLINEETLRLIKKAGCDFIQLGIESGNNEILKAMRKNITIEEAIKACKLIKKYGFELHTFFMVGFPQETEETINDTIKAMKQSNSDGLMYSIFTPYPGTESFDFCKEKGLVDDNFDVSLYNHQSPQNCFCMNISKERFRVLVNKIEKMIDKKNAANKRRRLFSMKSIHKLKELGLKTSLKRGLKILFNT